MKWKCEQCNEDSPCVLEIDDLSKNIDEPTDCPYGDSTVVWEEADDE